MSNPNHPWCRDVSRDEAIRAAEDAAAAERTPLPDHRDLPAAVAELQERVGRLEAAVVESAVVVGRKAKTLGSQLVERLQAFNAAIRSGEIEMPKGPPPQPAPVPPADGLRTERVTPPWQRAKWDEALAIICDGGDWGRGNNFDHGVLGALVIWADKEMDRLTAERDAAIRERDAAREECDRLRAILPPESERGRGVGEGSWAVFAEKAVAERDEARADLATMRGKCDGLKDRVAELEAAAAANAGGEAKQEPPRGWLTSEERQAVEWACGKRFATGPSESWTSHDSLKSLLARSTPPLVRRPHLDDLESDERPVWESACEAWIAAIREAGGEVA